MWKLILESPIWLGLCPSIWRLLLVGGFLSLGRQRSSNKRDIAPGFRPEIVFFGGEKKGRGLDEGEIWIQKMMIDVYTYSWYNPIQVQVESSKP